MCAENGKKLYIIKPRCGEPARTERLDTVLADALRVPEVKDFSIVHVGCAEEMPQELCGAVLFVISLGVSGVNLEYYALLKYIRLHPHLFDGCTGALIVDGAGEFYTKSVSRELVLAANMAGCAFIGRPLVEGTGTLFNYNVQAKIRGTDQLTAYRDSARELVQRLLASQIPDQPSPEKSKRFLALHAGNATTSNTLGLWHLVREHLGDTVSQEISLRDGEVWDCRGCSYETCHHLGEEGKCFYGGVITRDVYPALQSCTGLVMICPNYNDAVGANLTAFINRMTAIFNVRRFYETDLYAVIVSGYSGSDIVAQQLISSLCMNKSFHLPPRFAMMETANDPRSIYSLPGIEERAERFAGHLLAGN